MTPRPVVSVDARLAEIEELLRTPMFGIYGRVTKDHVYWLLSQLRDARAENERLTIKAGQAMQDAVAWRAVVQNRSITEIMAERDDLRTRLAAAERGLEMTDAELEGTRKRADRAEAALAAVREWATGNYGGTKRPIDIWPGFALALAAEQDEPKRCGHGFGEAHDFGFMASQWCPGPVSQPTEGERAASRCECDWKWHKGQPCQQEAADHGSVHTSPELCIQCLYVCEGERDDEEEASR